MKNKMVCYVYIVKSNNKNLTQIYVQSKFIFTEVFFIQNFVCQMETTFIYAKQ